MLKLLAWCKNNALFLLTLLLLVFIPLYPKLPLIDIRHTWVYIRIEDVLVLVSLVALVIVIIRHKVSIRTPLTIPILVFWIIGAIATIHGVLLVIPGVSDIFPNVVLLSYIRRIEYMSLFFLSYLGLKDKRLIPYVISTLIVTMFLVTVYGIGQKYIGFPAFLTMNEEFAKGIAIRLSNLSRVSSTFSGHYDLAAYLVLLIPISVSLFFGVRRWFAKAFLLITSLLGSFVMFMTVSRISFFALFIALGIVFLFQKKKLVISSIAVGTVVVLLLLSFSPSLLDRFGSTIKEVEVLVDATTGEPLGHSKEVTNSYFQHTVTLHENAKILKTLVSEKDAIYIEKVEKSTASAMIAVPYDMLPKEIVLLDESVAPTGENLPQGTGYINLSLSPTIKNIGFYFFERKHSSGEPTEINIFIGKFLIKKALAYDLSFTTRFQGEWPHAYAAFRKNIFFGSGYGSVGLAVDNSYLRMLGEVGLLGFASFFSIFIVIGIYIKRVYSDISSSVSKSFVVGFLAGFIGLMVNALFIDVFEASKIAYLLWLLCGVIVAILHMYQKRPLVYSREFLRVLTSGYAMVVYLFVVTIILYSSMINNYFVGDDFTWFRWVGNCVQATNGGGCPLDFSTVVRYFSQSDGFFYRPGAKIYFHLMYWIFWLNQTAYHMVSILLHFVVSVLVFLIAKKVFNSRLLPAATALLFLVISGYTEAVFWISATGFLFTASLMLSSLLAYVYWKEKKSLLSLFCSLIFFIASTLFHELGIVTPLLFILYEFVILGNKNIQSMFSGLLNKLLLLPVPLYFVVRYVSGSHWLSGDYNYNLLKLPFNAIGNFFGYTFLTLIGPYSSPVYLLTRTILRTHVMFAVVFSSVVLFVCIVFAKRFSRVFTAEEKRVFLFGFLFSVITLIPFLGLGNISSRYLYVSSIGIVFIVVIFIQKLYLYFISTGKDIAMASVGIVITIFCLIHIIQIQKIHDDWQEAGVKSRRFVVAIDGAYEDYWANKKMEFHFANIPIRTGEAWVLPVGIDDVLWLIFRNPNITVYKWRTVDEALAHVEYNSLNQKVFEFDDSGVVIEHKKTLPSAP